MFDVFLFYTKFQGLLKKKFRVLLYFGYIIEMVVLLAFSLWFKIIHVIVVIFLYAYIIVYWYFDQTCKKFQKIPKWISMDNQTCFLVRFFFTSDLHLKLNILNPLNISFFTKCTTTNHGFNLKGSSGLVCHFD
jgi:hypothetical protein